MNGQVRDSRTGAIVNDSLPPLSEVTPSPSSGTPQPSPIQPDNLTLPNTPTDQAPILTFSDKLNQAVNLARKNRNAQSLGMMKPFQGTLAASDFNSILGNFNAASDNTAQDLINTAKEQTTPTYDTLSDASGAIYQVQKDPSGQIIGTPQLIFPGKANNGSSFSSKGIEISAEDSRTLTGAGFTPSEIDNIVADVNQHGIDSVLEGITDKSQKTAIEKVFGIQSKVTRDQIVSTVTLKAAQEGLKSTYTDNELKALADQYGYSSFWTNKEADIQRFLDSDKAKGLYVDLLYKQYQDAGQAE